MCQGAFFLQWCGILEENRKKKYKMWNRGGFFDKIRRKISENTQKQA